MIDLSLPAIVKQIIFPPAKLIHKMFEMRTITKSFSINGRHQRANTRQSSSCYFQYLEYTMFTVKIFRLEVWWPCYSAAGD